MVEAPPDAAGITTGKLTTKRFDGAAAPSSKATAAVVALVMVSAIRWMLVLPYAG